MEQAGEAQPDGARGDAVARVGPDEGEGAGEQGRASVGEGLGHRRSPGGAVDAEEGQVGGGAGVEDPPGVFQVASQRLEGVGGDALSPRT